MDPFPLQLPPPRPPILDMGPTPDPHHPDMEHGALC